MEISSFHWEYRDIRYLCHMHKTGSYTTRLWQTPGIRSLKNHFQQDYTGYFVPIEDLRQAIGKAKRILTKEKIHRQLAGQSSSNSIHEHKR